MRKTRRACGPLFWVEALAVALMAFTATSAMALTVVEKRLAALRPCSHLKMPQKMLGVTVAIGIDTLKAVALDRATLTVAGDVVTLSFAGSLACRTGDDAPVKGDASVDLTGAAAIDLADCSVRSLSITPTRFGGSLGEVVKGAWEPLFRPKLEADVRKMLVDACTDFVNGK